MQESAIWIMLCGQYLPDEAREDMQVTNAREANWSQTASIVEIEQNKRPVLLSYCRKQLYQVVVV